MGLMPDELEDKLKSIWLRKRTGVLHLALQCFQPPDSILDGDWLAVKHQSRVSMYREQWASASTARAAVAEGVQKGEAAEES